MAVKAWAVGDVLSAADMNAWTVPLAGVKSANQTISSTTTLINDADMRFSAAANSLYEFHAFIRFSSGTGQDFKCSFTVPAGASAIYQRIGRDNTGAFAGSAEFLDTDSLVFQGNTVGVHVAGQLMGVLDTAGTGGNFIFQWAQQTSGAFNTTLYANSYLTGRRIG